MSLFNVIKNAFLILIFIQVLPLFIEGIKKQYSQYIDHKTSVGVLNLNDSLYDSSSLTKQLHQLFKNNDVKAILLKVDSPGSTAGAGESVAREIAALKKEYPKPIVSLVQNSCTSGAYWIACQTDYIIAPGTAILGSIGIYISHLFQLNEFIEQYKIKYNTVKAGTYKTVGDPFKPMTPEEHQLLQAVLDDSYDQFTTAVATARKLSLTKSHEWADGKIFSGKQAFDLHLIDEIGSLSTAIRIIKEKALIEGEIEWYYPSTDRGLLRTMLYDKEDQQDLTKGTNLAHIIIYICNYVLKQQY